MHGGSLLHHTMAYSSGQVSCLSDKNEVWSDICQVKYHVCMTKLRHGVTRDQELC